jgi:hypothetical protein
MIKFEKATIAQEAQTIIWFDAHLVSILHLGQLSAPNVQLAFTALIQLSLQLLAQHSIIQLLDLLIAHNAQ